MTYNYTWLDDILTDLGASLYCKGQDSRPSEVDAECDRAKQEIIAHLQAGRESGNSRAERPSDNIRDELIEQLAATEHERWADWQKWCHEVLREQLNPNGVHNGLEDVLHRWDRQIATPYTALSEAEKQSDRDQVERYLPVVLSTILRRIEEGWPRSYKDKVGLDVALLWDSADATDGYNQALADGLLVVRELLGGLAESGELRMSDATKSLTAAKRLGYIDANLSELLYFGRKNPCEEWAIDTTRLYLTPAPKLTCMMPADHEYEYGVPHIDVKNGMVWRNGLLDYLWIKEVENDG